MIPDLVVDALAAHRLARLVTADDITQPIRDAVIWLAYDRADRSSYPAQLGVDVDEEGGWQEVVTHDPHPPKLATLVTCRWCAGMWITLGIVVVRRFRWWRPWRDALALSSSAVLLARLEDD